MKRKTFLFAIIIIYFVTAAQAQQTASQPTSEELQQRIRQIETQMETMREELTKLKQSLPATTEQITKPDAVIAKSEPKAKTNPAVKTEPEKPKDEKPTLPAKQLGVDIGSARLTPYGTIYFNAFSNSAGTNNTDVPLFAATTGAGNASASVRQTRLGFRLEGARVGNARLGAVVEVDFFGGFPSVGIGENFGVVRLRLANARLDWEKTSVIVGQDWMVFAPNNPISLASAAIPQMAAAGNPWARLPQIKLERKLGKNFTWTGAVLAQQTGDFGTNASFFLQPTSGASSSVPFFQSRIAASSKNLLGTKKAGSVGLSAHYGRSRIFTGATNVKNNIDSLGFALDWNLPLATRFSLAGEAFFGRNLGGFQSGIFQSYNPDFAYRNGSSLVSGGVRAIGTRGGWAQFGFTPPVSKDRLTIYGSIGVDEPRDKDLTSLTRRDLRTQNLSYAFDLIYKFTPQFSVGAEFRRFETLYLFSDKREANHVNLGAAYSF